MMRIMAVASGKGGVGKTWFSITLAHTLSRMNRRVLLVDCDVGLANVDVQLGLTPSANLNQVVLGEVSLGRAVHAVAALGLDVLPGRSGAAGPAGLDSLFIGWIQRELRRIGDGYDVVILDLPSGVEQGVRELMRQADDEIVLTTGEPTALTDAYALIKATRSHQRGAAANLVVNFAETISAGRQTLDGLLRVCDRFLGTRVQAGGVIRRDVRVPETIGRQTPLLQSFPRSDAARDMVTVAETLTGLKGQA